jgi:hypothetical protein
MQKHPKGVILLFLVLIMGGASLTVLTTLARGSLTGLVDANEQVNAYQTRTKLMGCLDETLIQLKKSASYAPATVSSGNATCSLAVASNGTVRTATLSLTENSLTRRVVATIQTSSFAVTQVIEQ